MENRRIYSCAFFLPLCFLTLCLTGQLAAQAGFAGPGHYQITNARTGAILEMDANDQTGIRQVPVAVAAQFSQNQVWEITPAPVAGYYVIRNSMNGTALETVGPRSRSMVRALPYNGGPSQQWRFDADPAGSVMIVS